jgi:site-specific DNA-methyltransferase (adenine-specific)
MNLQQFFTPVWAAELLVRRHFPDLSANDTVLEPTCGDGRFLLAIPPEVEAYGVEIDPAQAAKAVTNTGRQVLVGDFRTVDLPRRPTVVLGNPPFDMDVFDGILARCHELLENNGRAGFLLPVYAFQTASRVMDYQRRWSISQELLPRNLFDRMSHPILWATFRKERKTVLSGFFLYSELHALAEVHSDVRRLLVGNQATASCWRDVVELALRACGGRATLAEIYRVVEANRPTANPWWREKVRQIAGRHFCRISPGVFSLKEA